VTLEPAHETLSVHSSSKIVRFGWDRWVDRLHLWIWRVHADGGCGVGSAGGAGRVLERAATLASSDRDFARFGSLRWSDPLAG
jgi:hypothetical protein